MSLINRLSGKTLCVALAPHQLAAQVRSGRRVQAGSAVHVALTHPEGDWQGALAALEVYLAQAGAAIKGLPLSLSLSNRWCQLTMLPWSDALLAKDSAARFLDTQFAALFGDSARGWTATCDDAPYGEPRLACAIDTDLLAEVRRIASHHGHPCIGVEAALSIGWRAIAGARPEAFAVVEPGRIVFAAARAGRIVAVQAQACHGDWRAELVQGWRRWSLRLPQLARIDKVALIRLDGGGDGAVPDGFHAAPLPAMALGAEFAAVGMMEG